MCPKMDEKALLEQLASFILEHEKEEQSPKVEELKNKLRKKMDPFSARFAAGAQELLKSLKTTSATEHLLQ